MNHPGAVSSWSFVRPLWDLGNAPRMAGDKRVVVQSPMASEPWFAAYLLDVSDC
jgi:hypothetical protein